MPSWRLIWPAHPFTFANVRELPYWVLYQVPGYYYIANQEQPMFTPCTLPSLSTTQL